MSRTVEVHEASVADLQRALAEGRVTSLQLVESYLERIEAFDAAGPELNAIAVTNHEARAEARALDGERREHGPRGPLHGIPLLVKDNYDIAGMPTSAGSRALEGLVAQKDAAIVAQLRQAGAIVLAKANLHELAAGMTTVGSAHGRTRNPYDPGRNPGGSSGGTSAGIAASFAAVGLGTDTVGSIRIAAAQTALFGLRPTQGLTSVEGIAPLCLSQDTAGPLARTVHDLALVLDVITDSLDPSPHFVRRLDPRALAGRRIGRLETLFGNEPEDREVAESGRAALQRFAKLGAEVIPVELPELPALLDTSYMLILGEFPGDLAAYLGRNPTSPVADLEELAATGRVHPEVAPLVAGALAAPWKQSDQYRQAIANRKQLRELVLAQMESARLDALAYPTIRRVAAPLGEEQLGSNAHLSANSGLPAISMPIGFTDSGLPVGLELLGPQRSDEQLVAMAYAWERTQDPRRPPPTTPPVGAGAGQ